MIIEALLYIIGFYFFAGIVLYVYSVVKSWEVLGFWDFSITRDYIALCKYPKWLLFWLYWIVKKIKEKQ